MADRLTRLENMHNHNGAPNKQGKLGCPCCRLYADTNVHRRETRRKAKKQFNQEFRRELSYVDTYNPVIDYEYEDEYESGKWYWRYEYHEDDWDTLFNDEYWEDLQYLRAQSMTRP